MLFNSFPFIFIYLPVVLVGSRPDRSRDKEKDYHKQGQTYIPFRLSNDASLNTHQPRSLYASMTLTYPVAVADPSLLTVTG